MKQISFSYLANPLISAAENLSFNLLKLITEFNKKIIKNPLKIVTYRNEYEKKVKKLAQQFTNNWQGWADKELPKAYILGIKGAEKQLTSLGKSIDNIEEIYNGTFLLKEFPPPPGIPPIPGQVSMLFADYANHQTFFGVFRQSAYYSLSAQEIQIMRTSQDIYRNIAVMAAENNFNELDILTRQAFSQDMLDKFANKGIQTITYRNGAVHTIDNYCEMLGRTLIGRCALQANLNRMLESDYDLGIVSSHFRACDLCVPYEGVTLSIDGKDHRYESLDSAMLQGLFHCNCLHDISPFFEGLSIESMPAESMPAVDPAEQELINEFGYDEAQKIAYQAQEKQRYIERQIRKWKRRDSVSLDNKTKQYTSGKIKEWQKTQREHIKDNQFLVRQYDREQIRRAH